MGEETGERRVHIETGGKGVNVETGEMRGCRNRGKAGAYKTGEKA